MAEREEGRKARAEREREARAAARLGSASSSVAQSGSRSRPPRAPAASASVSVSTIELGAALRKAAAASDSVCLRLDFPGAPLAHSLPVRASALALPGPHSFRFSQAIPLGADSDAGLSARRELFEALGSDEREDGDVVFELVGLSRDQAALVEAHALAASAGTRAPAAPAPDGRLLASGVVSLDDILEKDADIRSGRVELRDATAGAAGSAGALSVDVRAVDALRELDNILERLGSAEAAIAADAKLARALRSEKRQDEDEEGEGEGGGVRPRPSASPAARRGVPVSASARAPTAAREAARRERDAQPYLALTPRVRATAAKLRAEVRAGRGPRAAEFAGALSGAFGESQLAERSAAGELSLSGALAAAAAGAAGAAGGAAKAEAAAQLLLRPVKADGVPRPPAGFVETARALRLCLFDPASASIRGNVLEVAALPAAMTAGSAAAAAPSVPWGFGKSAAQLLARAAADFAASDALLLVQLDVTLVPADAGGGAGGGAADARRSRAGAPTDSAYWRRRRARPRTFALCWGALPLRLLAEWRPALGGAGGAGGAVKERALPLFRGSVFDGSGPLAVREEAVKAALTDANGRRARAAPPPSAGGAAVGGARAPIRGALLTLALAPPSPADVSAAAGLPSELLCELAHVRILAAEADLLRAAAERAALAGAPAGALQWAPEAAALAQLARAPDLLGALGRVWAARLRGADAKNKGAAVERAALGDAAVTLCLLLSAAGVPFARAPIASAAEEQRRAELIAAAEKDAAERGKALGALAAPAAGALVPAFRYARLLVHDPVALAASHRV